MEPIRHTMTARLGRLNMYREDLDELVALFQRKCTNVIISDQQYRYESLDEMKGRVGSKVKDLEIHGENPGLHFLLNQSEPVPGSRTGEKTTFTELRTEQVTDEAEALFFKVREFLVLHQGPRVRIPFLIIATMAFIGTCFSVLHAKGRITNEIQLVEYNVGFVICL